jgi:hypothetical protein
MTQSDIQDPLGAIHLEYVLSTEEFMEGQRTFCSLLASKWVRFNYKAMAPIGLLLIIEGIVVLYWGSNNILGISILALGAYFVAQRLVLWPRKMRREFAQYPDHGSTRTLQLDQVGIVATTSHGSGTMLWSRFSKFLETDKVFVLLAPPRFLYTIPKRSVPPEDMDRLRAFLNQKLIKIG